MAKGLMTARSPGAAAPLALLALACSATAFAQDVPAANATFYWQTMAHDQLATIAARDDSGPTLNAVIVAKEQATWLPVLQKVSKQ